MIDVYLQGTIYHEHNFSDVKYIEITKSAFKTLEIYKRIIIRHDEA